MKNNMYDNMFQTDLFHWWFRGKREIVDALVNKIVKSEIYLPPRTIIDFGCGCGLMLKTLKKYGEVSGADFSERALDYCRQRFDGELFQIDLSTVNTTQETYYLAVALDILEHIEHDDVAAKNIYNALLPGGYCIITVPAFQWLWSTHDKNCMHRRRYNLKELKVLLQSSGFQVDYISYYNCLLFPAAVCSRLLLNIFGLARNSELENGFKDNLMNRCLYKIFKMEQRVILKGKNMPFGLSIICLARKVAQ